MAFIDPTAEPSRKQWLIVGGAFVAFLGVIFVPLFGYFAVMNPGKEIATVDVTVGAPFELAYVSNGEDQRVWLDLTCTSCEPNALEGKVTASNEAGKMIAKTKLEEPMSGYTYFHSEVYGTHTIEGHPFLDVPAQPKGKRVTIRGTLNPEPMQVYRLGPLAFNEGLPLPNVSDVRVWVAP